MSYEALSRALAYASSLFTMSLFATTLAVAAAGVGKYMHPGNCSPAGCATMAVKSPASPYGGLTDRAHVEAVAAVLWSKKI